MKFLALIVLCLSALACSAPAPEGAIVSGMHYAVIVDPGLTTDQRAAVVAAAGQWAAAVPGLTLDVSFAAISVIAPHQIGVYDVSSLGMSGAPAGDEVIGRTEPEVKLDSAWVQLNTSVDSTYDAQQIAAHELGHAMGLSHTPSGIMCADTGCASRDVLPIDVAQFFATRGQ